MVVGLFFVGTMLVVVILVSGLAGIVVVALALSVEGLPSGDVEKRVGACCHAE